MDVRGRQAAIRAKWEYGKQIKAKLAKIMAERKMAERDNPPSNADAGYPPLGQGA